MLERRSESARRAVSNATVEARQLRHPQVGTEHLVLGLLRDEGPAAAALVAAGATLTAARHRVAEVTNARDDGPSPPGLLEFTARAQRALDRAGRFARQSQAGEVDSPHILLGILDVEGLGAQVLRGIGVDVVRLRDALAGPQPTEETATVTAAEASTDEPQPGAVSPICPRCGATLADTLAVKRLLANDGGARIEVYVAYCGGCGTAFGVTND